MARAKVNNTVGPYPDFRSIKHKVLIVPPDEELVQLRLLPPSPVFPRLTLQFQGVIHLYSSVATGTTRIIREFKITTTATATGTSLNKRFNEQNNGCARAL